MGHAARNPEELGTTKGDKMFHAGSANGFHLSPKKKSTRSAETEDEDHGDEDTSCESSNDDDEDESGDEGNSGSAGRGRVERMHEDGREDHEVVGPEIPQLDALAPADDDAADEAPVDTNTQIAEEKGVAETDLAVTPPKDSAHTQPMDETPPSSSDWEYENYEDKLLRKRG